MTPPKTKCICGICENAFFVALTEDDMAAMKKEAGIEGGIHACGKCVDKLGGASVTDDLEVAHIRLN